ncbi:MAG: hypothetical protein A2Y17_07325 [Clostridiales bacterium GWF2_38_85]|nr:MAG: hypothetical protein A2Y17_07325 [Clostridiales bacterium GWF2_38_85]HBL84317.1 FMN-binding protein [Clostridiales bacterium]
MKKKTKIIISVVAFVVAAIVTTGYIIISGMQKNLDNLKSIESNDVDLSKISDGTYSGSYKVLPISVEVSVTVKDHKITAIDLLKHDNGKGKAAETIINDVIKADSLKVDAVTGATYSSKVILLAIEDALSIATETNNK